MADIYLSDKRRRRVLRVPILPENMPEVSQEVQSEEFTPINNKPITIIGEAGLRTVNLSSLLPTRHCYFAKSDVLSTEFIDFVENSINKKQPIRLVMTGKAYISMLMVINSFTYSEQRNGFISYTLDLKEYGG